MIHNIEYFLHIYYPQYYKSISLNATLTSSKDISQYYDSLGDFLYFCKRGIYFQLLDILIPNMPLLVSIACLSISQFPVLPHLELELPLTITQWASPPHSRASRSWPSWLFFLISFVPLLPWLLGLPLFLGKAVVLLISSSTSPLSSSSCMISIWCSLARCSDATFNDKRSCFNLEAVLLSRIITYNLGVTNSWADLKIVDYLHPTKLTLNNPLVPWHFKDDILSVKSNKELKFTH